MIPSKIETSIDYKRDLTVHIASGNVNSQDILDILETYYRGKPTTLILWDFTNATGSRISYDELRRTAIKANRHSRPGGKSALVFSEGAEIRIDKILEELEDNGHEFVSFRNIEDAERWLGLRD